MSLAPFWGGVIAPVLAAVRARRIVEIGADRGHLTARLLAFARRHRAIVHVVDPEPAFDVRAWEHLHRGRLVCHRRPSLDALPELGGCDAVLIDGDHNWYTVLGELRLLDAASRAAARPFPVVLLHDVEWPYGRRDLYTEPRRIPPRYRRRWRRGGLHPTRPQVLRRGGLNADLCHAVTEDGPRNGVRTAVEDFMAGTRRRLRLLIVPGFHGLGVLVEHRTLARHPRLARLLAVWDLPPPVRDYVEFLERSRLGTLIGEEKAARTHAWEG